MSGRGAVEAGWEEWRSWLCRCGCRRVGVARRPWSRQQHAHIQAVLMWGCRWEGAAAQHVFGSFGPWRLGSLRD